MTSGWHYAITRNAHYAQHLSNWPRETSAARPRPHGSEAAVRVSKTSLVAMITRHLAGSFDSGLRRMVSTA